MAISMQATWLRTPGGWRQAHVHLVADSVTTPTPHTSFLPDGRQTMDAGRRDYAFLRLSRRHSFI
jgi:hypothetical protein